MSALRDDLKAFKELNAEVFGVNSGSLNAHQKFSDRNAFDFPLLVDEHGTVTEAYRARKTPLGGTARTVYIVDKQGIIRYAKRGMPPDEELLKVLKEL